jgi:hypothetical protein
MNVSFLETILENDGAVPACHSVAALTTVVMEQLGSTSMNIRETSYGVLCIWVNKGPGVYYTADELRNIGRQVAKNLKVGIGEQGTDTVFRRAFSVLVLDKVIDVDNRTPYLDGAQVRQWLEQGLDYLKNEQDLRGWVAGKGWAHAIAHASDLFWVLTRSRYLGAADLERILNTIAEKISEPVASAYIYEDDERLVSAVMSALLRDLLDMSFLNAWLDRLVHPAGQSLWREVQTLFDTDEARTFARHNTTTFLRSLYFQLLLGNNPHPSFTNRSPAVRDALLSSLLNALRAMDRWVYAKEAEA